MKKITLICIALSILVSCANNIDNKNTTDNNEELYSQVLLDSAWTVMEFNSDHETAKSLLFDALSLEKADTASIYYALGMANKFEENYNEAISYFDNTIQLDSSETNYFSQRGMAKQVLKNYDAALADFKKALSIDSVYTMNYWRLGSFYIETEDYENAILILNEGIKRNPYNFDPFLMRAIARLNIDSLESACLDYNKAKELGMKETKEELEKSCN